MNDDNLRYEVFFVLFRVDKQLNLCILLSYLYCLTTLYHISWVFGWVDMFVFQLLLLQRD